MTITNPIPAPLPPYAPPYIPYNNITPFTYRDGLTYLEKLEDFQAYVNTVLVPYFNDNFEFLSNEFVTQVNIMIDTVNNALAAQDADVDKKIADLTKYVDDTMAKILADGVQLQDPVMYGIVSDANSQTGKYLRTISTLMYLAPKATGTDQSDALSSALNTAATFGLWLALNGDHVISKPITLVNGSKISGIAGTIRQTGTLKSAFIANNVTRVKFKDVKAYGLKTDYVNNSSVYGAAAVYLQGSTNDVIVDNCHFLDWAGAGVYMRDTVNNVHVRNTKISGAGSTYILGTTYNYSGGVVTDNSIVNWSVINCDISAFAQGIVTGDNLADVRILQNLIHDIPGQHGMYIESVDGCIIAHNEVRRTALLGMKIQIGVTSAIDPIGIIISNNVFDTVGSQGILITNAVGGTPRVRRLIISGNTVNNAAGVGIEGNNIVDAVISNNIVENSKSGIRLVSSSEITVVGNRLKTLTNSGIWLSSCTDVTVDNLRVINPASAKNASDMFGVYIDGTSADIVINRVKITDTFVNMRYGIYLAAGDSTTMSFLNNNASGASDYGWRMGTAGTVLAFAGNNLTGSLGTYTVPPTNYAQQADTSGATLANLEIEVNKLKAVLRANNIIRT